MIRRIRGEVIDRLSTSVVVDVHGVGYQLVVTSSAGVHPGQDVDLHVHTHVREDSLQLFGFADPLDLEVFELLITVPTIGPVKAMGIMETPVFDIVGFVREQDVKRLSKLPGVGKKTAERMVVDLRDKFQAMAHLRPASDPGAPVLPFEGTAAQDVASALVNLGFKSGAAEAAAAKSLEKLGLEAPLEELLKEALGQVSRR